MISTKFATVLVFLGPLRTKINCWGCTRNDVLNFSARAHRWLDLKDWDWLTVQWQRKRRYLADGWSGSVSYFLQKISNPGWLKIRDIKLKITIPG
ncbi:hypothetical protein CS542_07980 [Pedobacter sp. IW39]|nr:hypothetical protein CS542_07980 [Pedobacter sp. IW39]